MNNTIDIDATDEVLAAYVDDELDPVWQLKIERVLEHDATAREKVCMIREVNWLLRAAYKEDEVHFPA